MDKKITIFTSILGIIVVIFFVIGIVYGGNTTLSLQNLKKQSQITPTPTINEELSQGKLAEDLLTESEKLIPEESYVNRQKTPDQVRAVYMSAWVASTPSIRNKLVQFILDNNINSVVIDIKDATGRVSFLMNDPLITEIGSHRDLVKDMSDFIKALHEKNIYVIGRISVFQDPYLSAKKPELAIQSKSTQGPWKDKKGLSFLDPTNESVWDYTFRIARESHAIGFDEINFDYIRFPSDGNIADIQYPQGKGTKADMIEKFFQALYKEFSETGIITSADLFGMTTNNTDDLGIGQVLEKALPYFDYISPMIYPSHYPSGFYGHSKPAEKPYEIITIAMKKGIERAEAMGYGPEKLRPWIQDFDMGAKYTKEMVQLQIQALRDLGIMSYMSWDPANTYTVGAY